MYIPNGAEYYRDFGKGVYHFYKQKSGNYYIWNTNMMDWTVPSQSDESIRQRIQDGNLLPLSKSGETSAPDMLKKAAECISDRASERDTDSERSMKTTVEAFNAMYGKDLTEEQGWMFMVFLKAARAKGGDFREDDYVDGAAYFALAGEAHGNQ